MKPIPTTWVVLGVSVIVVIGAAVTGIRVASIQAETQRERDRERLAFDQRQALKAEEWKRYQAKEDQRKASIAQQQESERLRLEEQRISNENIRGLLAK